MSRSVASRQGRDGLGAGTLSGWLWPRGSGGAPRGCETAGRRGEGRGREGDF